MRAVVQRVSRASVTTAGECAGSVDRGFLVLLGVESGDAEDDAAYISDKISGLRVFEDDGGKMNLSLADVGGGVLVVSQFTLLGDCRKGKRPSFVNAAEPATAERLYLLVVENLRGKGHKVETGRFRADMDVELVNNGPVTLLIDSKKGF